MYIKKNYEHSEPDGHHDLFIYENNEQYLLFLQEFFLDACRRPPGRIVFFGPEKACRVLKGILKFWNLAEKKSAVAVSVFSMESFFDPDKRFNRRQFLISIRKILETDAARRIYSCVDMNLPIISIKNEKAIFSFIAALNSVYSDSSVIGFCSLFFGNCGEEHRRRNFLRQFRKVYFSEGGYANADLDMYWRDKDCGADSGIIELLAGNRHCSEKLLSGMLLDPTGERELSQEKRYDQRAGRMINEVLWLIDQLGNVTYVSAAIELISGKNSVSYIGKNIFHAVSPGNMQITQEIYRTGIKHSRKDTVGPVISRGTFIVGKNRKISLIISFLPMKIDRELVGFVGSFMCEENSGMKTRRESRLPEELNERERRILEYLVEGCSNKEIGNRMALAEITVKKSLTRIYEIFKVVNRSGLMAEMYKIK